MPKDNHIHNAYQITIEGNLDLNWSTWFNRMEVSYQDGNSITILTGPVADQAELRGILNKIWDLNRTIISMTRLQDRIY